MSPLKFILGVLLAGITISASEASFVKRCNKYQLCLDGKPWYFQGANAYWLIEFVRKDRGTVDRFFDYANQFGLKVIRLWAFNRRMPYAWGKYDEAEFQGLDYIIDSAGRHNIKLILALGNTWQAYRSPQDFMSMAGVDPAGKTLLEFYSSSAVRNLYRDHISAIVWRNNTFNGRRYRDDDAIMMWDAMNEPRCPGCMDAASQGSQHAFLQAAAQQVRANAPNQLVALGTEGYFLNTYESYNPGAGGRCEGEDWVSLSKFDSIDATVVHVYERQMESVPPKWNKCDFNCFCNYMVQYLSVHQRIAADVGKPLIMEEYGLIMSEYTAEQRVVLFQLVADNLAWMKATNGPMMGVMFWNAAIGNVWDDGYNVYLDAPIQKPKSSPRGWAAASDPSDDSTSTPSIPTSNAASEPSGVSIPTAASTSIPKSKNTSALATSSSSSSQPESSRAANFTASSDSEPSRAAIYANTETLTDFLRGPQRAACAEDAARWWLPMWTAGWAQTVDMAAYSKRCQDITVLQVLLSAKDRVYSAT